MHATDIILKPRQGTGDSDIALVMIGFISIIKLTMKAIILAGGFGTRISEETSIKPKTIVTIGNFSNFMAYLEDLQFSWN